MKKSPLQKSYSASQLCIWLNSVGHGLSRLSACLAALLSINAAFGQLIEVDFNTSGDATQSLVNRGTLSVTGTANNGAGFSTDVPSVNTGGYSGLLAPTLGSVDSYTYAVGSSLSELTSFTLTAWINPTAYGSGGTRVISMYNPDTAYQQGFAMLFNSSALYVQVDGQLANNGIVVPLNEWTFVAVTYDGTVATNNVRFYTGDGTTLSGAVVATANAGTTSTITSAPFVIGTTSQPNDLTRAFSGSLDNIRVYGATSGTGGVLDASALTSVMTFNDVVPEPSSWTLAFLGIGISLISRRRRMNRCGY